MRTQKVYFLKGLPASGKSTWAKQKIEEDRQNGIITKRTNKDDLRAMLDNSIYSKEREKFIIKARDNLISLALVSGYNVIVDDTNFFEKHLKKVKDIVLDMKFNLGANIEIEEIFFDTSPYECIRRDEKRENPVGRDVIYRMYKENSHLYENNIEYNPELQDCIIVDVDGTLAIHNGRKAFDYRKLGQDNLNTTIRELISNFNYSYDIHNDSLLKTFIMTGRENVTFEDGFNVLEETLKWLYKYGIKFHNIFIRADKDQRPDWIVKKELYEKNIKDKYNVLFVVDDRKQVIDMWRREGLTVLDVAGNEF